MSLDINLECEHCGCDIGMSQNITHNLTPLWRALGVYDALYESHGKHASDYLPALRAGLAMFEADFDSFIIYDSPNGWGLARHALPWLREWVERCEKHPDARIWVSR